MLNASLQNIPFALVLVLLTWQPSYASLEQLGDAWADVQTFGAWGKSRDQHNAEIERLNKQFEEELARTRNIGQANESTARIQEKLKRVLDTQYLSQKTLQIIALVDVVMGQLRDEIVVRYKLNQEIRNFSEWFDLFSQGSDEQINALAELLKAYKKNDDGSFSKVQQMLQLSKIQSNQDLSDAKTYVADAVKHSSWRSLEGIVASMVDVRRRLIEIVEEERGILKTVVREMQAEDLKRRHLCHSDTVGIYCDGVCRYYDATGRSPCGAISYLNVYPVEPFVKLLDRLQEFHKDAIFYADYGRINEVGSFDQQTGASTTEIFRDKLNPTSLLPKDFLSSPCQKVQSKTVRLLEAIGFAEIFGNANGLSSQTRSLLSKLRAVKGRLKYSLDGLLITIGNSSVCSALSDETRKNVELVDVAITAVESLGDEISRNASSIPSTDISAVFTLSNAY